MRRISGRSSVHKEAKLFFGSSTLIDCVVHNLTNSGARVEVPVGVKLPEAFGLTFDGGYSLRPCRIVWRRENETGVKFL
jgi:hypothetical protein